MERTYQTTCVRTIFSQRCFVMPDVSDWMLVDWIWFLYLPAKSPTRWPDPTCPRPERKKPCQIHLRTHTKSQGLQKNRNHIGLIERTLYLARSSLERGAERITRRSLEGALKWAARDLRREEARPEIITKFKLVWIGLARSRKIDRTGRRTGVPDSHCEYAT